MKQRISKNNLLVNSSIDKLPELPKIPMIEPTLKRFQTDPKHTKEMKMITELLEKYKDSVLTKKHFERVYPYEAVLNICKELLSSKIEAIEKEFTDENIDLLYPMNECEPGIDTIICDHKRKTAKYMRDEIISRLEDVNKKLYP